MARVLNLSFGGNTMKSTIQKLDRRKLYGYTIIDVRDDNGLKCELASISDDGKYILAKGCTAYVQLNNKNEYISNSETIMVDSENKPLEKIQSSFDLEKIELVPGKLEDYFTMNVKSTYQLNYDEESTMIEDIKKHKLLYFKFNYRTDYDYDDAFVLQNDENVFMVIGRISPFEFIGLEQPVETITVEEDEDDDLDFGML